MAAIAQPTQPAEPPSPTASAPQRIVVTGNPLGRETLTQAASSLSGDELTLLRGGTLGQTLSALPGVAASSFGPQSSRPVIRGLDGDRVRLLDNGGASADASNLSFDHAVAIDPLVIERIEVLRGPVALLYGGNATGGVVNAIDNRIPRAPLSGLGGRAELRLGGAAAERAAAVVLEGGQGGFNWHTDAARRRSADLRVPRFTPQADGTALAPTERVANSAGNSHSGALGASWADADGFVGAAFDSNRNLYGVTVEPDVTIAMRRERLQLAGERRRLVGPIIQTEFSLSQTRYRHDEIEGSGDIGTTFRSTGRELRLQARHAPFGALNGALHGVIGVQVEQLDFAALGAEAFVPTTRTRSQALFMLEEWRMVDGHTPHAASPSSPHAASASSPGASSETTPGPTLTAGLRLERARLDSAGDAADAEEPRFGPARQRRFAPLGLSLGGVLPLTRGWRASATFGRTERAPAYYELFANGVHVATGAYERGDPGLAMERSVHADVGLHWQDAAMQFKANLFTTRFSNFIALDATGAAIDGVPEFAFSGVPAKLHGLEVEGQVRLAERPWTLDANANLDLVRGQRSDTGAPLPRLAPLRWQLGLKATRGAWQVGAQLQHANAQTRVPANDVPTPGHTLLKLWLGWQQRSGELSALWFVRIDNATDALAYNAVALRTARELAPEGGRALTAGVRVTF